MAVYHNAQAWREAIRGHEGEFLTMMIGNPAVFVLENSVDADLLVDLLAEQQPCRFIELVGRFAIDEVEVA